MIQGETPLAREASYPLQKFTLERDCGAPKMGDVMSLIPLMNKLAEEKGYRIEDEFGVSGVHVGYRLSKGDISKVFRLKMEAISYLRRARK